MKNTILLSALAVTALGLASCSNDDMPVGRNGNDSTTIQVQLPANLNTRADATTVYFGNGQSATKLYVAIYEQGTETILFSNFPSDGDTYSDGLTVTDFNPSTLTATVNVNLVKDKAYDLVFWAANPAMDDVYTWSSATQSISVSYEGMTNFDETRDAFYNHLNYTADNSSVSVTLYRPFAQINIGTSDLAAYERAGGEKNALYGMNVTDIQNSLNLMTGEVSQSSDFDGTVTVSGAAVPPQMDNQTVPFTVSPDTYQYLAMGYFLVGGSGVEKSMADVTLTVNGTATPQPFANVPTEMNYRTNIYGALLTNPAEFDVTIDPAFEQPNYNVGFLTWDGTSKAPVIDETTKTGNITSPEELAGLAELVKGGNNYDGYTFTLTSDMDVSSNTMPQIGSGTRLGSAFIGTPFKGTFDGNGKTIRGLNLEDLSSSSQTAGMFAAVSGTVKNLTLEDVNIKESTSEQTGAVAGVVVNGGTIDNVTVKSGSIAGTEGVGAIAGRILANGTVSNCTNNAAVSGSKYNVGGIVGAAYYTQTGKEMHITGCTNNGVITSAGVAAGGIVGFSTAFIDGCDNYGAVNGTQNSAGGIAGTQRTAGGISNCNNYANITCQNTTLGVGGIAGWVTYQGGTGYPQKNVIVIENCTNSGNIVAKGSSPYGAGGIVGTWYNMGTVKGCTNTATLIQADRMIAGIVGNSQWGADENGIPDGAENMLYITDNKTTTTLDQMVANSMKALLVYINDASKVTLSGNTPASNN